jgi:signal transduction histidine kinase
MTEPLAGRESGGVWDYFTSTEASRSDGRVAAMVAQEQPNAEELSQRLAASYNELAELAGSLAHEIKNPLSVIRMNMDLLAEDLADGQTQRDRRALNKIEMVQKQVTRLENLLNDFLRFARLRNLDLKAGSLNEQIERVLDLFEPQARELNVDIIRYLEPDLPGILLESQTLQAALVNLIKNALEAMPHGGQLLARTRLTRVGVALDLIDTGCGMDDKTALQMFDAFYSTKNGGSGLGLPTARKIIEAHGARIDVQSAVGRGTKFTIEFPTPRRLA